MIADCLHVLCKNTPIIALVKRVPEINVNLSDPSKMAKGSDTKLKPNAKETDKASKKRNTDSADKLVRASSHRVKKLAGGSSMTVAASKLAASKKSSIESELGGDYEKGNKSLKSKRARGVASKTESEVVKADKPPEEEVKPQFIDEVYMQKKHEFRQKICKEIVEEYWTTAWKICSERFYQGNAPVLVTLELRDAWLRILEMEWMDFGQSLEVLPAGMFKADDPPLPLQIDSWARGHLELLPQRRESIMDPFLHDDIMGAGGDWEYQPLDTEGMPIEPVPPKEDPKQKQAGTSGKKSPPKPISRRAKTPEKKPRVVKPPSAKPPKPKEEAPKNPPPTPEKAKPSSKPRSKGKKPKARSKGKKVSTAAKVVAEKAPQRNVEEICGEGEELEGEYEDGYFIPNFPPVCFEKKPIAAKPYYSLEYIKAPLVVDGSHSSVSIYDKSVGLKSWIPSDEMLHHHLLHGDKSFGANSTDEYEGEHMLMHMRMQAQDYADTFTEEDEFEDDYEDVDEHQDGGGGHELVRASDLAAHKKLRLHSVHDEEHAKAVSARIDSEMHKESDELIHILAPHESRKFKPRDTVHGPGHDDEHGVHLPVTKTSGREQLALGLYLTQEKHAIHEGEQFQEQEHQEHHPRQSQYTKHVAEAVAAASGPEVKRKTSILDMKDAIIQSRREEMKRRFSQEKV